MFSELARLGAKRDVQDCYGMTPLHFALAFASKTHDATFVNLFLETGAQLTKKDLKGRDILTYAKSILPEDSPIVSTIQKVYTTRLLESAPAGSAILAQV